MIRLPFHRSQELVAVRNFRLDSQTMLSRGDPLPAGLRLFHRMSLYRRRLVGSKNDPWVISQIPVPTAGEKPEAE